VLVVLDTNRNRQAMREAAHVIRADFPLDGRSVLAAFADGHTPPANGIVVLRIPPSR